LSHFGNTSGSLSNQVNGVSSSFLKCTHWQVTVRSNASQKPSKGLTCEAVLRGEKSCYMLVPWVSYETHFFLLADS